MSVEALDVPTDSDVTLQAGDGVTVTISSRCITQSDFLQALDFEDDDRVLKVPTIPSIYLRFAAEYLQATCEGYVLGTDLTEEQQKLVTVRNVVYYPELLRYLYGYLGILSFKDFYQHMLVSVLEAGTVNANIANHLEDRSLEVLSEEELYQVASYQPARINTLYRMSHARQYLQLKLQRNTLALRGSNVYEVRAGVLWINNTRIATSGRVNSVHVLPDARNIYYYLMEGKLYRGEGTNTARLIPTEYPLVSVSVGKEWLAGMTVGGEVFLMDTSRIPLFPQGVLDIQGVREVISLTTTSTVVLLMNDGGVLLYGWHPLSSSTLATLSSRAPATPAGAPKDIRSPWVVRMVSDDGISLLTDDLQVIINEEVVTTALSVASVGIVFNTRLEAILNGVILERGVTAVAYDTTTRRAVFRAVNGALRYWNIPISGTPVCEFQRRR